MTDHFATLNEPRRPWLEPEPLKEKFLALSAQAHPDRVHNQSAAERDLAQRRYLELNAAYNCLRDPRQRLRHLLELELGAAPAAAQPVPADRMDLFLAVGQACRHADALLAEKAALTSPLLQVRWFERAQDEAERLRETCRQLDERVAGLTGEIKNLDAAWTSAAPERAALLGRLGDIHRQLGYFSRWTAQLRERIVQLSL